ncbi:MAG TPA: AarF/ABC1/UbiB kinase family protein, partial [Acidimicrobiia bacterium]
PGPSDVRSPQGAGHCIGMRPRHEREREIVEVLARHGMTGLLAALGRGGRLSRGHDRDVALAAPRELRLALEELGPTFVKFGQLLSSRADLLGSEYRTELARLQDAASPVSPGAVEQTIEHELGERSRREFASIELEPLAAASIGTAHAAVLRDGTEVVVKVRRPGAVDQVEQDLEILQHWALRLSRHWGPAAGIDVVGLADEFAHGLRSELDYQSEARNAERFAGNFAGDPEVQIPRVFWETTSSQVITLERIGGMKVTDAVALDAAGVDRHELADRAVRITAKMVFEHGFFHGDPHPGNFFIGPEGRIGIIDFGLVGELDERLRERLTSLLIAIVRGSPTRFAGALLALGAAPGRVDRAGLEADLRGLLARYDGVPVGEVQLGTAIAQLLEIARRHRLRLPRDLALLAKAIAMDEGMAAELDPGFRIGEALAPYAQRHLAAQLAPGALARRLETFGVDVAELAVDLPGQVHQLLDVLGTGSLELHLRTDEVEPLVARAERLGNRIAASVLVAAAVNGVAELIAADRVDPREWRAARRGRLAAVGAAGAWLAWRRGRPAR